MKIHNVRDNLRNTIAGKEQMLSVLNTTLEGELDHNLQIVTATTAKFLETNLKELHAILADIEDACTELKDIR